MHILKYIKCQLSYVLAKHKPDIVAVGPFKEAKLSAKNETELREPRILIEGGKISA